MKKIPVEFSKQEEVLKKLVESLASLYKANTKEEEKELEFQDSLLSEYNVKLLDLEDKLESLQSQAEKIKSYYFPGMSEIDLNNAEERNDFIADNTKGITQISDGIRISVEYGKLLNESKKIEEDIRVIKFAIDSLRKRKSNKIADINYKKRSFVAKYTNIINNVIGTTRKKVQLIKIAFAGDNITLKYDESATASLSLADLKKLEEISELINMRASEINKNEANHSLLDTNVNKLLGLEDYYKKEISHVNYDYTAMRINEDAGTDRITAFKRIVAVNEIKAQANRLGLSKFAPEIMKAIDYVLTWESYHLEAAVEDKEKLDQSQRNFMTEKVEIEKEILTTESEISNCEFAAEASDEHLKYLSNILLIKLNMILGEENLTIEEAKEKLAKEIANTPYAVRNLKK